MLTLSHAGTSVRSIKARLVMHETGLPWTSVELDLVRGGRVLVESSIIIGYLA
ncbi:glutathione S-transferase [Amorphus suaedae]